MRFRDFPILSPASRVIAWQDLKHQPAGSTLKGDQCYLDDARLDYGDYHLIRKGARHGNIHTPEGCVIFARSHSSARHSSELTAAR